MTSIFIAKWPIHVYFIFMTETSGSTIIIIAIEILAYLKI